MSSKKNSSRNPSTDKIKCPTCPDSFDSKGFGRHRKACEQQNQFKAYEQQAKAAKDRSVQPRSGRSVSKPWEQFGRLEPDPEEDIAPTPSSSQDVDQDFGPSSSRDTGPDPNVVCHNERDNGPLKDDIKIEYHLHTNRSPDILPFKQYQARKRKAQTLKPESRSKHPWKPFRNRAEFEFAEVALKASLNKKQVDQLINVMQRCITGAEKFEIRDHAHLCEIWNAGSVLHAAPRKHVIQVEYQKNDTRTFDFWSRSLWDWALEHVTDPFLVDHIHWDAERLFKFDGTKFVRFLHEPYTADRFWNIQSSLPPGGKPLCFILYADKTKLSSFGTTMGYPIYGRIGNIDIDFRNSDGIGGGELVGWLPIVPEDEAEKGKKTYVDFKRVVWHQSFIKLLETIAQYSATGCWVKCGDGIERHLFPVVLMLSADYEEQCVMGSNRGVNCLQPCPICHVPHDKLHDLCTSWPRRTGLAMQKIIEESRALNATQGEELLKANGLRAIDNAFMSIENSDPYEIMSYDHMHNDDHGLGGKHLYPSVMVYLRATGRGALVELDNRFSNMPSWSGLTHFDQVVSLDFTDATKLEHIIKILLFASHNLIDSKYVEGLILIYCLRAYLNMVMYIGLQVHTDETIASGREAVRIFSELMKKYAMKTTLQTQKSWDIPKMHLRDHAFYDILAKGATRNYNTKVNENLHGPVKDIFDQLENGKNVDERIMQIDQWSRISKLIRFQIDLADGKFNQDPDVEMEDSFPDTIKLGGSFKSGHIIFGAVQTRCSLQDISAAHADDPAFLQFRSKFSQFVRHRDFSSELSSADLDVMLDPNATVYEYRYLKVSFTSTVTWEVETNHLRCNPNFNKKPRYDYVLIKTPNGGVMFGQLIFMFTIATNDAIHPWVLIQPYDSQVGQPTTHEKNAQLFRIRAKVRAASCFISAKSIIRGVVVVPSYVKDSEYYVFDVLDDDLFMRMQDLWKARLGQT